MSILNRLKPQPCFILEDSIEENPSSTIFEQLQWKKTATVRNFLLFEQDKTPAVRWPYFILAFSTIQNPSRVLFQHFK